MKESTVIGIEAILCWSAERVRNPGRSGATYHGRNHDPIVETPGRFEARTVAGQDPEGKENQSEGTE